MVNSSTFSDVSELSLYCEMLAKLVDQKSWGRITRADLILGAPQEVLSYMKSGEFKNAVWFSLISRAERPLMGLEARLEKNVTPHDILFEGIITFLDGLVVYKGLLKRVYDENPLHFLGRTVLARLEDTMQIVLEKATVGTGSLKGILRLKAFNLIFLNIFTLWIQDATPDQSKTLAALNIRLAQAEELAGYLGV